jgi:beta-lactamase class D
LFGKTGSGHENSTFGWFVGWVEKDEHFFVFAYNIRGQNGQKINLSQRIPRVKQLLTQAGIIRN